MNKVTFTEAAQAAGVHFNTLRNWRKSNKLTTAEKVFENGVEIWVVELSEVEQLSRQSRHKRANNNKSSVGGPNDESPPVDVPGAANNAPLTIRPDLDNFMVLVERSQKPLLERIDHLTDRVENLARENGDLSRENDNLKERLQALEAAQAARVAQAAQVQAAPVDITPKPEQPPQPAQEPEKKSFWRRLLGG